MKNFITISIIVILCFTSAGLIIYSARDKSISEYDVDELNSKLHTLSNEQQELQNKLDSLTAAQSTEMNGKGTISILFNSLYPYVYTDIYPLFSENNFVGMLALSEDSMPSLSGCMTEKQFKTLIGNGWTTALYYNGETPLSEWLTSMKSLTKKFSVDFPNAIYFTKDVYTKDLDDTLKEFGIKTIIHHGEESLPLVSKDVDSSFFYLASIGWNSVNANTRLQRAMEKGASLLFTIGTDVPAEIYKASTFPNMVSKVTSYIENENLFEATADEAKEYRQGVGSVRDESYEKYQGDIEAVQKQLEELEEERKAIVAEYTKN